MFSLDNADFAAMAQQAKNIIDKIRLSDAAEAVNIAIFIMIGAILILTIYSTIHKMAGVDD